MTRQRPKRLRFPCGHIRGLHESSCWCGGKSREQREAEFRAWAQSRGVAVRDRKVSP